MKWKFEDVATELAKRMEVSKYKASNTINQLLDILEERLIQGDEVYLKRLGKFSTYERKWHLHKKGNRWNPFDDTHKRGYSVAPSFKFSNRIKRKVKERT